MTTPMSAAPAAAPAADPLHLPHLWEFAPGLTYLNHGAFGAVPIAVRAERQRWQELLDANPMGFYRRRLDAELDRARLEVARFLGADDEGVAFTQNATTGIATVLAALPLAAGDRILVTDHVYGAVLWNAQLAARRAGGEVDVVPVPLDADDAQTVAAVLAGVTERTRVAILDHISSATAKLFPIAALVAALRERGVRVVVDAAHAPGAVPVDLRAIDPDFWAGNLHKWAAAPRGTAALYARAESREDLPSFPVSWRAPEGFPNAFNYVGTVDQTGWLSAPAGLAFFGQLGWEAVRARNNALARTGQQLIAETIGANLEGMPGERDPEAYALPMRLIPLDAIGDDRDACLALTDRLAEEFAIEVPIETWNGRALIRVCAQLYNREADYERLASALKVLL
jgi:isopenicillin-N epimerase